MKYRLRTIVPLSITAFAFSLIFFNYYTETQTSGKKTEQEAIDSLTQQLTRTQSTIEYLIEKNLAAGLQQEISFLGTDPNLENALLINPQNRVSAALNLSNNNATLTTALSVFSLSDRNQILDAALKATETLSGTVFTSKDRHYTYGVFPVAFSRKDIGLLIVQRNLATPIALEQHKAMDASLYYAIFIVIAALLLWLFFHHALTRRVAKFIDTTQHVAAGNLEARCAVEGSDEIAMLCNAFNTMTAQIGQSYRALSEKEAALRLTMDAAGMGTWRWNLATGQMFWAERVYTIMGMTEHKPLLSYEDYLKCVHPDDKQAVIAKIQDTLEHQDTYEFEHRIIWPDHSIHWLRCRGEVRRDHNNKAQELVGLAWDITAQKLNELAQNKLIHIIEHSLNEIYIFHGETLRYQYVNSGALKNLGYSLPAIKNMTPANIIQNFNENDFRKLVTPLLQHEKETLTIPTVHLRADGSHYPAEMHLQLSEHDGMLAFLAVVIDITERKLAAETLYQQKERAEVTLHSIGDAVITTDAAGLIDFMNPVAEKLTGWPLQDALRQPLSTVFNIINEQTRVTVLNPVERALREQHTSTLPNNTVLISRSGRESAIEDSAAPIRNRQGQIIGAVLVFHDVSAARDMAQQLSWQASHDFLTGLINRHDFENQLKLAIASSQAQGSEHTLLYLDLDQFKVINDTCGHIAGDILLKKLSALMLAKIRGSDVLGRLGGDEFGVLLQRCRLENGLQIADNLRRLIKEFQFDWEGKTYEISASIGVVNINAQAATLENALASADLACYAAKEAGRNRIHVYTSDDATVRLRHGEMLWISRINQAIEQNEFRLYRQAIVPTHDISSTNSHYELLLRLHNQDGTIIAPGNFMPAAERYNLMPNIDRWVVSTYFSAYQRLQDAEADGHNPHHRLTTINLSGASINDEEFLGFLHEQFTKHHVPPSIICFEFTETVAIANFDKANHLITELKKLGCRFALDDFGSGLSSFGYLKSLPVDFLKIDGGFVKNMIEDKMDAAMVETINQIGHVMGMQTVAEFVENDQILIKLREIGVDYAQGYGIDKPKPLIIPD